LIKIHAPSIETDKAGMATIDKPAKIKAKAIKAEAIDPRVIRYFMHKPFRI
jgi:hypothetical protein